MMSLRGILLVFSLGVMTSSGYLLYFRPENARFHLGSWYPLLLNFALFGLILGSVLIAVLARHLRPVGVIGGVLVVCAYIMMSVADRFLGETVGSYGWILAYVGQVIVLPIAGFLSLLAASVSLIRVFQLHPPARIPVIAAFTVIAAGLPGFIYLVNQPPDIARMLENLNDPDSTKRLETIHLLRDLKNVRIIVPMITLLRNPDEPFYLRSAAAWTLGNLGGDHRVIKALITASQEQDMHIREAAVFSLGQASRDLHSEEQFQQALAALTHALNDSEELIRIAAVQSLAWLDNQHGIRSLVGALSDDSSLVRYHAHEALVRLSGQDFGENADQWRTWLEHSD